jgi:sugar/nucleoside kinase (ribokinase family)
LIVSRVATFAGCWYHHSMKQKDLLAVGAAYLDINCPDFPLSDGLYPDTEVVGRGYILAAGGSVVNFTRLCTSLGLTSALVAKVGADAVGQLLMGLLGESGVIPELIVDEQSMTNISVNLVDDTGRSIMTVVGNANESLSLAEVRERAAVLLPSFSHLYIGGCFKLRRLLPVFNDLLKLAKITGTRVILDHGRLNTDVTQEDIAIVQDLARCVDYYLPSQGEFLALWGSDSVEKCMKALVSNMAGTLVVKDGARGAVTMIRGKVVNVPAFDVQSIHTIGAGDSFNAGFIAAILRGEELLESMIFGCATASLSISCMNPPIWSSVKDFIRARHVAK